jgi:hypothetical protein
MFKAIAVTPAIVIVFMTLASFWLPPQAGEKLLLNGFAAILICILLVYISQLLPILAATTPFIGERKGGFSLIPLADAASRVCRVNSCVKLIKFPSLPRYSYVLQPHALSAVHFIHNICHCHQHVS